MFTGDLSPLQRNILRAAVNVDISMCGAISFSHHGSLIHSAHHYSTRFFSSYIYGIDEYFAFTIIFTNSPLSCCLSGWVYNFNSFKFSWVPFPAMSDSFYYLPSESFFSCPRSLPPLFFLPHCYTVVFLVISSYSCCTFALFHYFCSSLTSPGTLRHHFTSSYHCKCTTPSAAFYCIHGDPRIKVPNYYI